MKPLEFWKTNSNKYPILAILARWFLAIPATSASIESTFSNSGLLITKSRSRLDPDTIKEQMLLKISYIIKDRQ